MRFEKISFDTHPIEQVIRKIALYRQESRLKQNPQYVKDMRLILSVFAALYQHLLERLIYIDAMKSGCINLEKF